MTEPTDFTDTPKLLLDWFELTVWLLERTAHMPKRFRAGLTTRLELAALDGLESLTEAQYARGPGPALDRASVALDRLRLLVRLSHRLRALDTRAYEHCAERLTEVGRMVGGWKKQASSRARSR